MFLPLRYRLLGRLDGAAARRPSCRRVSDLPQAVRSAEALAFVTYERLGMAVGNMRALAGVDFACGTDATAVTVVEVAPTGEPEPFRYSQRLRARPVT